MLTTMQCIRFTAMFMQRGFMSGQHKYGDIGFPNMQSIIELSALPDSDAEAAVRESPELWSFIQGALQDGYR